MEFSINLHTIKSEESTVYIEGLQVILFKNEIFLSLTIDFIIAKNTDPGEMRHYIWARVFTVCQSTQFGGFQSSIALNS